MFKNVWYIPTFNRRSPPSISVLSTSYSVISTKHGPYKFSEWKSHAHTTDCCHTCVLLTCIRTYIYRTLIGISMSNRLIQALLFSPTDKTLKLTLSWSSDHVNGKQSKSTDNLTRWDRYSVLQDKINLHFQGLKILGSNLTLLRKRA
jgi:hypothetical protein